MAANPLKKIVQRLFNSIGLEVRRRPDEHPRRSLLGVLQQARSVGLSPATIIDVGAAYGSFALLFNNVFPDAKYILVEPLEEYIPFLESVTKSLQGAEYILAAATAESGEVVINVHPDLVGSSLYLEDEESNNGVPRTVRAVALDSLLDDRIEAPFLIKVDVQGAELDVLLGAERTLRNTEYVILEVSLFDFFKGGPQFHDVVTFMKSRGFVAYDILGLQYRPLDSALSQVDIVFVKETGLFRKHNYYGTPRQREEQNKKFRLRHELRIKELSKSTNQNES
jgi:FkbM family methyltransferase